MVKEEIKNIKLFLQKHKTAIIILFLVSLFTYGTKLFHYSISIDTEVLISQPTSLLRSWIGIDRPVLVLLKYLLGLTPFNPLLNTGITYVLFTTFVIFLYYIFYRIFKEDSNLRLCIFGTSILTSAIYIEQLNFMLQSAEITILLNLICMGILFFNIAIESKKKIYYLCSIICTTLAFGGYQSFVPMFITIIALSAFLKIQKEDIDWKKAFNYCFNAAVIFIISLIGYFIGSIISRELFDVASASYLTNKILWFDEPVVYTIKRVLTTIFNGYFGALNQNALFYGYINIVAFTLIAISFIKCFFKDKNKLLKMFFTLILLVVPFSLAMVLGDKELYRAQLSLPIVISFVITFMTTKRRGKIIINTIIIACLFSQFILTNRLISSDYFRYKEDCLFADKLYDELTNYDIENKRVVMLGKYIASNPLILTRGETMGVSFFEWDQYEPNGVGIRAAYFMNTLGYKINANTVEDYEFANKKKEELEIFPKENSIREYDELIVVRLS